MLWNDGEAETPFPKRNEMMTFGTADIKNGPLVKRQMTHNARERLRALRHVEYGISFGHYSSSIPTGRVSYTARMTRLRDFFWYWGFKAFCEVKHPRIWPLRKLRSFVRLLKGSKPAPQVWGAPQETPKIIWMFWAQGWEGAPVLVKACRDSWIARNPDWEVRVLDSKSIEGKMEFDYPLTGKTLTPTNYANVLRLTLLSKEGGVWVDATTYCNTPLDAWLPAKLISGAFVYEKPKTTVADWLVAAKPNHPLINGWKAYEYRYWRYAKNQWRYFWPHYLFEYLIFLSPSMVREYRNMPRVSSDPVYAAQWYFKKGGREAETFMQHLTNDNAPLSKLDWRMELPPDMLGRMRESFER